MEEHIPLNWNLFGEHFVEAKLSTVGVKLHESTTKGIESLEYDTLKEAFETIFESFEKDVKEDFSVSLDDLIKFVKNMKNINPEVRKNIETILELLVKSNLPLEKKPIRLPWRKK